MKISEILTNYVNKDKHPRKIGRYWATDINSIMKGYLTPKNFFKQEPVDLGGCRMILTGVAMEDRLKHIFREMEIDCESQVKKEMKITDEITLVVKSDFNFKKFIIETKFPFSRIKDKEIPQRYVHQLECQYRAFYLPVYLGVLSVPFNLRLIEYRPSKRRWSNICRLLEDFHQKLKVGNYEK